ncbi:MAG: hypothetical protein IPK27_05990 [Rhodanobacteraceae bacterium]|nr:hypothetical protein [Rhodanobacteraceae bacterium]
MQAFLRNTLSAIGLSILPGVAALAAPPLEGILDPGFGTGGVSITSFDQTPDFADTAKGIAVSPSGRIYLAASIGALVQGVNRVRFGLARFMADGQLDTAFSSDGLASPVSAALASQNQWASGVLVRADGKPIVYGIRYPGGGARPKVLVCRYAVAGNLDPGFDGDGCVEPTLALIDNGEENAQTAIGLPDNRILIGGRVGVNPGNPDHLDALVLMLNEDGSVAGGFGTSGYTLLQPPGSTFAYVSRLVRLGDGRFIAIGTGDVGMFAARLSSTGQIDPTFGVNGYAIVSFADLHNLQLTHDWAESGAVDSQGRIHLCGRITYGNNSNQSVMAFARLTPGGMLDPSFSTDGRIVQPFIDVFPTSNVADCAVDGQDRLVAAVQTGTAVPLNGDFGVLRLLPDGNFDPRFNVIGQTRAALDLGGNGVGHERVQAMTLMDGRVIVAGTVFPTNGGSASGEQMGLLRFGSDRPFADGFE